MRSFKEYLSENTDYDWKTNLPSNDICWYLLQPTPDKLFAAVKFIKRLRLMSDPKATNPKSGVVKQINSLIEFFKERGGKKSYLAAVLEIVRCRNRASWTYDKAGTLYRGLGKQWEDIRALGLTLTGKTRMIPGDNGKEILFFEAKGTYTSNYPIQSWTNNIQTALSFSKTLPTEHPSQVGIIYSIKVLSQETLFNSKITNKITAVIDDEDETIRISNKPTPLTAYINGDSILLLWNKVNKGSVLMSSENKRAYASKIKEYFGQSGYEILKKFEGIDDGFTVNYNFNELLD
jgi:hypothetical protein